MMDVKDELKALLDSSTTLTTLLGGKKIYWEPAPDDAILPRITYSEDDNVPHMVADDRELISKITYQLGVFVSGESSTSALVSALDTVLSEAGWEREGCRDAYDTPRKVRIKILKYSIFKEVSN